MNLKDYIDTYPDFPSDGILFRDISPILKNPEALNFVLHSMIDGFKLDEIDVFVGIESRGFPFACALASKFNKSMIMVRKAGKLPGKTEKVDYQIEYGSATMEVQNTAVLPGQKVFICDDLLATGGTASASLHLLEKLGAIVTGLGFVVELTGLNGAQHLKGYHYNALVSYE